MTNNIPTIEKILERGLWEDINQAEALHVITEDEADRLWYDKSAGMDFLNSNKGATDESK